MQLQMLKFLGMHR